MPNRTLDDDDAMNQGDVVHTRKFTRYLVAGDLTLTNTFTAPKGHHLVFLYLGWQPKDGSKPFDSVQALKNMGWTPPAEIEQLHQERLAALASDATEVAK